MLRMLLIFVVSCSLEISSGDTLIALSPKSHFFNKHFPSCITVNHQTELLQRTNSSSYPWVTFGVSTLPSQNNRYPVTVTFQKELSLSVLKPAIKSSTAAVTIPPLQHHLDTPAPKMIHYQLALSHTKLSSARLSQIYPNCTESHRGDSCSYTRGLSFSFCSRVLLCFKLHSGKVCGQ